MANTRELSQLASLINVNDETKSIRVIANQPEAKIGIGTENPITKVDVRGDVNVSGVITANSFSGDGSNLSGLSTFSGNYEDLSNKPSIPSLVGYATEGYVNSSIANLVDSAPGALDTLNELAAALGDDSNFSTTITNSLASKANLSGANFTGVVTATSFYGDGSNLSNIISIGGVGIQSAGSVIGTGITTLNFIGAGNTFSVNGTTVDISIAGGNIDLDNLLVSSLTVTNGVVVSGVITATDFNSSSDINLKENVVIIDNPIKKLLGISGVTFNWKENREVSAGVIAQDVEKVFPEVVKTKEHKTVNYNGLIGLLVEVVKNQQDQINELRFRIDNLEG